MAANTVTSLRTVKKNVQKLVDNELNATGGLLRLAPCWVPRSFLQPGKRLKLHPDDLYAFGLNRGGIDERWFASTTPAANENRTPDEGPSYVVAGKQRFTLPQAVAETGATLIGKKIWNKGEQLFTAKELTVEPGAKCTIKDTGAYGLICVQGTGKINGHPLSSPKMIRFHELTEGEYICTEAGAKNGVTFENTSQTEPLVTLRYFGPEVNPGAPEMGAYRKNKFN